MDEKIRAAFDQIHTDEKTKRHTRAHLRRRSFDYGRDRAALRQRRFRRLACTAALLLLLAGTGLYELPAASIALDINPSIQLQVNAFQKVIRARGLNDDGKALLAHMELEDLPYTKALQRILICDEMGEYLEKGEMLSITVVGGGPLQEEEVLRNVVCSASAVARQENLYYCHVDGETARAAAKEGLSAARYLAFRQLQALDPAITPEDVQQMPMRQIKELLGCEKLDIPCDYYS